MQTFLWKQKKNKKNKSSSVSKSQTPLTATRNHSQRPNTETSNATTSNIPTLFTSQSSHFTLHTSYFTLHTSRTSPSKRTQTRTIRTTNQPAHNRLPSRRCDFATFATFATPNVERTSNFATPNFATPRLRTSNGRTNVELRTSNFDLRLTTFDCMQRAQRQQQCIHSFVRACVQPPSNHESQRSVPSVVSGQLLLQTKERIRIFLYRGRYNPSIIQLLE